MNEKMRFGIPMPEFRTDYGTLKTKKLQKIINFLNKRGVLIADCFDKKIVIVHPYLVKDIQEEMVNAGFQHLLIGSTVTNLRKTVAYIYEPNNIKLVKEGVYDLDTVKQASAKSSQYEIGEWT